MIRGGVRAAARSPVRLGVVSGAGLAYRWALALPTANGRLTAFAEVGGRWMRHGDASTLAVSPGVRYDVAPGMSVGLAVPLGLRSDMSRWGVIAQWQFRLGGREAE